MSQLAGVVKCKSVIISNSVEEHGMTYPWFSVNGIVRNSTECSPCYNEIVCPLEHNKCVKDIQVSRVLTKLSELLSSY